MTKLLRRVCTRYSNYFNRRHNRVGRLFQGVYRATQLPKPIDILYVNYYVHLNDWFERDEDKRLSLKKEFSLDKTISSAKNSYSSLPYYLGKMQADRVKPQEILDLLKKMPNPCSSYRNFLKNSLLRDFDEVLNGKVLED